MCLTVNSVKKIAFVTPFALMQKVQPQKINQVESKCPRYQLINSKQNSLIGQLLVILSSGRYMYPFTIHCQIELPSKVKNFFFSLVFVRSREFLVIRSHQYNLSDFITNCTVTYVNLGKTIVLCNQRTIVGLYLKTYLRFS